VINPGAMIGIVGGGQLARMSALAARAMGYRIAVADPDPNCPAAGVADEVVVARLDSPEGVAPLAALCEVVTYEFENIDPTVLQRLAREVPVHPGVRVLEASQNRIKEKSSLAGMGVPVAPWRAVYGAEEFAAAIHAIGVPSVLKTATEGYDGKGQVVIRTAAEAPAAYAKLAGRPLVLEGFVPFEREVSVVVARNRQGAVAAFPVAENIHRQNILALSIVPARVSPETAEAARSLAVRIASELELVGVLGVEMFVLGDGSLAVNELAPRPHNSGHYSMDACVTSQFEQHIRAVCGLPLGSVELLSPVVMANIMGEDYPLNVPDALSDPLVKLHLYGKREARPARKMGHLNALGATVAEALARAEATRERLTARG
jgi:5-(carboxyamino)imidazole ribonucleotide synthase